MIPREIVEEIRSRCDIEEVVGSYVALKRAGSNRAGLCPFHSEKSPSFTVFPGTRSFYCFGCGAGGDVITFIRKIENLDYPAAVEFLAARAGITLPSNSLRDEREAHRIPRKRFFEMNLEAARFYRQCLFDPALGRAGMEYLSGTRRLSGAVIKHFGLGFAPADGRILAAHMQAAGYTPDELSEGFLCRPARGGGLYDIFRNRVIFPVIETTGDIVAFGGRVMDDAKPKYLNSADTPVFKKSRVLFGLRYAKQCCAEEVILCEGYMDAIALHAAGFENAVATLGTAITQEHARLLTRYTKRVIINYDSDEAGRRAADKAMKLLDEVGLEVRVLRLPGAKDADEYLRTYGADAFRTVLRGSSAAFDYKLETVLGRHDLTTGEGKLRAARELTALIAETASDVARELYIRASAERLGLSVEVLTNDVNRLRAKLRRERQKEESRTVRLGARSFGDRVNPDAAKDPAAAAAEEVILGLLLLYDEHRAALAAGRVALSEEDFFTALGRRVFHAVMEMERSPEGFSFSALGEEFSPEEMGRLTRIVQDRQRLGNNDLGVLTATAAALREKREKREKRESRDIGGEIARRRSALERKKDT